MALALFCIVITTAFLLHILLLLGIHLPNPQSINHIHVIPIAFLIVLVHLFDLSRDPNRLLLVILGIVVLLQVSKHVIEVGVCTFHCLTIEIHHICFVPEIAQVPSIKF